MSRFDRRLFRQVAGARWPGAEQVLPRLSQAANHGLLWFGVAGLMAAIGGPSARRAARRGVASLALASLSANTAGKWLAERSRPPIDLVPLVRRLTRQPHTSSFPSGHSASAAAFAAGVAIESPALGALVAPLAAAVAFSRVYVGVHYPGDVLAGTLLGLAAAGTTRVLLPPGPRVHDRIHGPASAPALPRGAGLTIVVNSGSGAGRRRAEPPESLLRSLLPEAEILLRQDDADLLDLLERAAANGTALGVCGGDGSVNAAAGVALRHGLPLAVFPGGTLNHFARDLGAESFEAVAGAVERGEAVPVDLSTAEVQGGRSQHFVNTFSIGIYPELVRIREKLERRTGKTLAGLYALLRVLPRAEPLEVHIDGRRRRVWLVFAGNGSYSPEGLVPAYRRQLDDGVLDLRLVDADLPFARTRLVAAALTGSLADSPVYLTGRVRRVLLEKLTGVRNLAIDGEVAPAGTTVELSKQVGALTVYRPAG